MMGVVGCVGCLQVIMAEEEDELYNNATSRDLQHILVGGLKA
jgi:hypothetical protein